jgi:hypothetical protein
MGGTIIIANPQNLAVNWELQLTPRFAQTYSPLHAPVSYILLNSAAYWVTHAGSTWHITQP